MSPNTGSDTGDGGNDVQNQNAPAAQPCAFSLGSQSEPLQPQSGPSCFGCVLAAEAASPATPAIFVSCGCCNKLRELGGLKLKKVSSRGSENEGGGRAALPLGLQGCTPLCLFPLW